MNPRISHFNQQAEPEVVPDTVAQFVVRCARPLLRRFDNPFFALEMQLLDRRTRPKGQMGSAEALVLFSFLLMGLSFLMIVFSLVDTVPPPPGFAGRQVSTVGIGHTIFCAITVFWGVGRLFQREHLSGTLQDLFLIPIAPCRWVLQKSQLVFFVLALAWLSALPFHLVLCVSGTVVPVVLFKALFLPLWLGLVLWAYSLISMPDYLCDPPRPAPQGETSRPPWQQTQFALKSMVATRSLLSLGFGIISFVGWMGWIFSTPNDINPFLQLRPFYDMIAPAGLFWLILNVGFFAAALAHGAAMLSPSHQSRRRAAALCWCALISTYYTGLGFLWPHRPGLQYWSALIAPAIIFAIFNHLSERQRATSSDSEDVTQSHDNVAQSRVQASITAPKRQWLKVNENWSRREIEWLAKRYDNAVFIKDLRVHLRGSALLRQCFGGLLGATIALWLLRNVNLTSSNWWIWVSAYFAHPAARSAAMWQQEARGVTLTMLLLSPLSSREMIRGRIWAALTTGMMYPVIAMGIVAYLLASSTALTRFAFWPAWFSVLAVPVLALIMDATSVPGEDMEHTQVAHASNGSCLAQVLILPSILLALLGASLPLWLQWALALILVGVYAAWATLLFDNGVLQLDKRRLLKKRKGPQRNIDNTQPPIQPPILP